MKVRELVTTNPENPHTEAGTIVVSWPNCDWGTARLSCDGLACLSSDQVLELIAILLETLKADHVGAGG
jgi:hypothetical protein